MDLEFEQKVDAIVEEALSMEGSARENYVLEACAEDPKLKARVQTLLNADLEAVAFMDEPVTDIGASVSQLPEYVGPYRLIRELGRGGMGAVFLAEQTTPFQREVAIKFIQIGFSGEEAKRRFELEQQSLARMNHSSIAKLFETGQTDDGIPYFVMEYVEGKPITEHCDAIQAGFHTRLSLVIGVCEAIAHAHFKGVVHRDIKPSNVLVADLEGGVPKLIDFGIAKDMDQTGITRVGGLQGSFSYMSPEQAGLMEDSGEPVDIDVRTDVYALGVLLYELLVGQSPLTWGDQVSNLRIIRDILEKEPDKPSRCWAAFDVETRTRLSKHRNANDAQWQKLLLGDLDRVVMKSLEKHPNRRYSSPLDLAADLRRLQAGQPVSVGPDKLNYRLQKFVKRNKFKVFSVGLAALAVMLLPISFLIAQNLEYQNTLRERDRALRAQKRAETISEYVTGILTKADPGKVTMKEPTLREVLDRAYEDLQPGLSEEPEIMAYLMTTIGVAYTNMAEFERADELLSKAWEIGKNYPQEPDQLYGLSHSSLGWLRYLQGNYDEAETLMTAALTVEQEFQDGPAKPYFEALNALSGIAFQRRQYAEADYFACRLLETEARHNGENTIEYANYLNSLASANLYSGQSDLAEGLFEQAFMIMESSDERVEQLFSIVCANIGNLKLRKGEYGAAEYFYQQALYIGDVINPLDYSMAIFHSGLGIAIARSGRPAEGLMHMGFAQEICAAILGPDHREMASFLRSEAQQRMSNGEWDIAKTKLLDAKEILNATFGPNTTHHKAIDELLARIYIEEGRYSEVETLLANMTQKWPDSIQAQFAKGWLAVSQARQGQWNQAETGFQTAFDQFEEITFATHATLATWWIEVARMNLARTQPQDAVQALDKATEILTAQHFPRAELMAEIASLRKDLNK